MLRFDQDKPMERAPLDRRRLEDGHLRFCILDVIKRYRASFPSNCVKTDLQESLEEIAPIYYQSFTNRYACK